MTAAGVDRARMQYVANRVSVALLPLLVGLSVAAFALAAQRGLDLTDEGYYILNYRHWRETAVVTYFGAYFSAAFLAVGESLPTLRLGGLLALMLSALFFVNELIRSSAISAPSGKHCRDRVAATAAAMATATYYYGAFPTLFSPSYNLLSLLCALVSSGLLLRFIERTQSGRPNRMLPYLWGLVISIAIANKFSSGFLFAALECAIAAVCLWRRMSLRQVALQSSLAALGLATNLLALLLLVPDLPTRISLGLAIQLALLPRDVARELAELLTQALPLAGRAAGTTMLPTTVLAGACWILLQRRTDQALGFAAAVLVLGCVVSTDFRWIPERRIPMLYLTAIALTIALHLTGRPRHQVGIHRLLAIVVLIFALPFAYSFGTNNRLFFHMSMASVFPANLVIVALLELLRRQRLPRWLFLTCLAAFAASPLESLARAWVHGGLHTYRLGAPLAAQTEALPANRGNIMVKVAAPLASAVRDYQRILDTAGFAPGTPMLEFTGQSPGLVALASARPLGVVWMIGGHGFDGDKAARLAIDAVNRADIEQAWLLTSDDSFARIGIWREIIETRLGEFPFDIVGEFRLPDPSAASKTKMISVKVWRPRPGTRR